MQNNEKAALLSRFKEEGLNAMSEREILRLLLSYTLKGDALDTAERCLLNTYGSLRIILNTPARYLNKIEGVNEQTAIFLSLFYTLAEAANEERNEKVRRLNTTQSMKDFAKNALSLKSNENFLVISLNEKGKILSSEIVAEGSVNRSNVEPRKILTVLLSDGASQAVLAHNHPGGACKPSQQDLLFTREIQKLLNKLGIHLKDHIIVGRGDVWSLREKGYLKSE